MEGVCSSAAANDNQARARLVSHTGQLPAVCACANPDAAAALPLSPPTHQGARVHDGAALQQAPEASLVVAKQWAASRQHRRCRCRCSRCCCMRGRCCARQQRAGEQQQRPPRRQRCCCPRPPSAQCARRTSECIYSISEGLRRVLRRGRTPASCLPGELLCVMMTTA